MKKKYSSTLINRIGTINKNKFGSPMEVVVYNNVRDIWVKFLEHGNLVHTGWKAFCEGEVRNVYDKSALGIGYIGEGKYKVSINRKHTPQYKSWQQMLNRCYGEKTLYRQHTYNDCSVATEWHNFQNFAKWYDENHYEVDGEEIQLDKDILVKGNKIYSPNTCIFVPQKINMLFVKSGSRRGDLPIGIHFHKGNKKYIAQYGIGNGKQEHIGCYNTPEEAFQFYKGFKEKYIKQVAEEYKEKIPVKLYEAMMNYEVEITD